MGMELKNDELALTAMQEEYLAWLCQAPSERIPPSKAAYAVAVGVTPPTLYNWEKKPVFRDKWKSQVDVIEGSPERTQRMLDSLYQAGLRGDSKSADLWLRATNRMQAATAPVVPAASKATELSDTELDVLIAAVAAREKASRVVLKVVV